MKSTANKKDSSSTTHASNNYLNDDLSGNFSFQSYEQSPHFSPYVIQAKMSDGQFDDKYEYEEEADAMADTVVQQKQADNASEISESNVSDTLQLKNIEPEEELQELEEEPIQKKDNVTDTLQLKSIAPEEELQELEEQPIQKKNNPSPTDTSSNTTASPSQLSTNVRGKMEGAFQTDFSNVKIHQNSSKAKDMGAYAFTQGNDVHFASGQYNPATPKGQELIGHELTHVVQQRSGRVKPTTQAKGLPVNNDAELEREADDMGAKAAKGETANLDTKIKEEEPTTIQGKGLIQMKAEAGGGAAGGEGAATSGGEGPISLNGSQTVIKNLAVQTPTGFIQGVKTTPTALNSALAAENTALKGSFPQIEQPTGLENRPSKASQKGQGHPMGMTPGTAGTPHPNTPGGTGMGTGGGHPMVSTPGTANTPHPNTPSGTGMGTGGGHPTNTTSGTSTTPHPNTPGGTGMGTGGGHPTNTTSGGSASNGHPTNTTPFSTSSGNTGGSSTPPSTTRSRPRYTQETVTIGDESVNLDVGDAPELDLSGEANPQKLQTAKNADSARVTSKHSTADRETTKDFGENDIYPEYPELEQMTPQVEAGIAPVIEIPEMEELPSADPQITAAFDVEAKAHMDQQVAVEMAKNDAEVAKMQAESQLEWTNYNTQLDAETQRVTAEQQAAQDAAKAEVESQRENWRTENQAVKDQFEKDATAAKVEKDGEIDTKITNTNQEVAAEFDKAEAEATEKARVAEEDARQKEAKSNEEGFIDSIPGLGWLVDKASAALDWLKDQFNKIVNALKEAITAIINKVKEVANRIIDAARNAIIGFIKLFGEILKGLVDIVFAAFPEIRDRIKGLIDTAVNVAVEVINTLADGLKAFVSALLDALGAALNFILSAYQLFINILLGDWKLLADILLGMLKGIVWVVEAATQMPEHLFWEN